MFPVHLSQVVLVVQLSQLAMQPTQALLERKLPMLHPVQAVALVQTEQLAEQAEQAALFRKLPELHPVQAVALVQTEQLVEQAEQAALFRKLPAPHAVQAVALVQAVHLSEQAEQALLFRKVPEPHAVHTVALVQAEQLAEQAVQVTMPPAVVEEAKNPLEQDLQVAVVESAHVAHPVAQALQLVALTSQKLGLQAVQTATSAQVAQLEVEQAALATKRMLAMVKVMKNLFILSLFRM